MPWFLDLQVGGQRNERKKWIHCFENVTAVLFVAALSEYNQVLYEDETQNRLVESLTLFDSICQAKWMQRVPMILFLNKRDIFAEKLPNFPLVNYFAEYQGENDYDSAVEWITQQFLSKNGDSQRQIYVHQTCATDESNVQAVFNAVKDIILVQHLSRPGLINSNLN